LSIPYTVRIEGEPPLKLRPMARKPWSLGDLAAVGATSRPARAGWFVLGQAQKCELATPRRDEPNQGWAEVCPRSSRICGIGSPRAFTPPPMLRTRKRVNQDRNWSRTKSVEAWSRPDPDQRPAAWIHARQHRTEQVGRSDLPNRPNFNARTRLLLNKPRLKVDKN
jgi:hypothetical protein